MRSPTHMKCRKTYTLGSFKILQDVGLEKNLILIRDILRFIYLLSTCYYPDQFNLQNESIDWKNILCEHKYSL